MTNFNHGDIVSISSKDGLIRYMCISFIDGSVLHGRLIDTGERTVADAADVQLCPRYEVTAEQMHRFLSYDITVNELAPGVYPYERIRCTSPNIIDPDEIREALRNCVGKDTDTIESEWLIPFYCISDGTCSVSLSPENEFRRFFLAESSYITDIYMNLRDIIYGEYKKTIDEVIYELEVITSDDPTSKNCPPDLMRSYIKAFDNHSADATDAEKKLFIKYIDELCKMHDISAMRIKAYEMYGGDGVYPCDWNTCEKYLLEVFDAEFDPDIANTLGYIYYYGRTDGTPHYDLAFRYFTIGASAGNHESQYKLADMYERGQYVKQNTAVAMSICSNLYYETMKQFIKGDLSCKFADVALRLGLMYAEDEIDTALGYLFEAKYAIRMRENLRYIGDKKVAARIDAEIERLLQYSSCKNAVYTVHVDDTLISALEIMPVYMRNLFDGRRMEAKLRRLKDGQYEIKLRISPRYDSDDEKLFITLPKAHYSALCDSLTLRTTCIYDLVINGEPFTGADTTIEFDEIAFNEYRLYGRDVMLFNGEYDIIVPNEE